MIKNLPSPDQLRKEFEVFRQSRIKPIRTAILGLERERDVIQRKIDKLEATLSDLQGGPRRGRGGAKVSPATLARTAKVIHSYLAERRGKHVPSGELQRATGRELRPAAAVAAWNLANPGKTIRAEGKGRARKYVLA